MLTSQVRSLPLSLLAGSLLVPTAIFVASGAAQNKGVTAYSTLCTEAESGDVSGYRITLFRNAEGASVRFEYTEGALMEPLAARATLDGENRIRFGAMTELGPFTFEGRFEGGQIVGILTGLGRHDVIRLPRVRESERRIPACS